MFQKIAKHRANDASNDVHRPPLGSGGGEISPPGSWGSGGKRESRKRKNTSSSPLIVEIIFQVAKSFIRRDHQSLRGLSISGKREPEIGLKVGERVKVGEVLRWHWWRLIWSQADTILQAFPQIWLIYSLSSRGATAFLRIQAGSRVYPCLGLSLGQAPNFL